MKKIFITLLIILTFLAGFCYAVPSVNLVAPQATNSTTPELQINAVDATKMQFSCDNTTFTDLVDIVTPYSGFTITSSSVGCDPDEGNRTVYVKVFDDSNNTATDNATIKYDITPPATPSVIINGDDDTTNQVKIYLDIDETGGYDYIKISCNNTDFSEKIYVSNPQRQEVSLNNSTAACDTSAGNKTVYVKFFDNAGNSSTASDTIELLASGDEPEITETTPEHGQNVINHPPAIKFTVEHYGQGVDTVSLKYGGATYGLSDLIVLNETNDSTEYFHQAASTSAIDDGETDVNITVTNAQGTASKGFTFTLITADSDDNPPIGLRITVDETNGYISDSTPELTIEATDNETGMGFGSQMRFSCGPVEDIEDLSDFGKPVPYSETYDEFDVLTGANCVNEEGQKKIFAAVKDVAGNWTKAFFVTTNYSEFGALETLDEDDLEVGETTSEREPGFFVDVVNSSGDISDYVDGGEITFNGRYTLGELENIFLRMKLPNDEIVDVIENLDNVSEFSETYSIPGSVSGELTVLVKGKDVQTQKEYSFAFEIHVDRDDPSIDWTSHENNDTISDTETLEVEASDEISGIRNVTFKYIYSETNEEEVIGTSETGDNGKFSVDWNTKGLFNGDYEIVATAKDKAGNTVSKDLALELTGSIEYGEEDSSAKLTEARTAKDTATTIKSDLEAYNLVSALSEYNDLLEEANETLKEATELHGDGEYSKAEKKSEEAKKLFEEISEKISVDSYQASDFSYDSNTVREKFSEAGAMVSLPQNLIDAALAFFENNTVNRKIELLEVTENEETYYRAKILVSVQTDGNALNNVTVLEAIPKSFAVDANEIWSETSFTVINKDPVLQFDLTSLEPGVEKTFSYYLNKNIDQTQADAILDVNTMNEFVFPPLIFSGVSDLGGQVLISSPVIEFDIVGLLLPLLILVLILALIYVIYTKIQLGEIDLNQLAKAFKKKEEKTPLEFASQEVETKPTIPNPLKKSIIAIKGEDKNVIRPEYDPSLSEDYDLEKEVEKITPQKKSIIGSRPSQGFEQKKTNEPKTFDKIRGYYKKSSDLDDTEPKQETKDEPKRKSKWGYNG